MRRLLLSTFVLTAFTVMANAQIVVIVHPTVPGVTIDRETLADIYMLTMTKWDDDTPIRVFALKKGTVGTETFYASLGLNTLTLNKQWMRKQLTGEGRAPALLSEEDIVEHVASTPGAIGFVDVSHVTGNVKILRRVTPQ